MRTVKYVTGDNAGPRLAGIILGTVVLLLVLAWMAEQAKAQSQQRVLLRNPYQQPILVLVEHAGCRASTVLLAGEQRVVTAPAEGARVRVVTPSRRVVEVSVGRHDPIILPASGTRSPYHTSIGIPILEPALPII